MHLSNLAWFCRIEVKVVKLFDTSQFLHPDSKKLVQSYNCCAILSCNANKGSGSCSCFCFDPYNCQRAGTPPSPLGHGVQSNSYFLPRLQGMASQWTPKIEHFRGVKKTQAAEDQYLLSIIKWIMHFYSPFILLVFAGIPEWGSGGEKVPFSVKHVRTSCRQSSQIAR